MNLARRLRPAIAGILFLLAARSTFAAPQGHPKIDRALVESLRSGAATQHVIITVKAGGTSRADNIVRGTAVASGKPGGLF